MNLKDIEEILPVKTGSPKSAVAFIQLLVGADDDGDYGPKTTKKVKEAQLFLGLDDTGIVNQTTFRALTEYDTQDPPAPDPQGLPKGLGMFTSSLTKKTVGTPSVFVKKMQKYGVQWISPLIIFQRKGKDDVYNTRKEAVDYMEAARDAGIGLYPWGYSRPEEHAEFFKHMDDKVNEWQADGVCLDPEHPYYGRPKALRALMATAINLWHAQNRVVMVSSYGRPAWHKPFPWKEIVVADAGIPQVYSDHKYHDHVKLGLAQYGNLRKDWPVIPAFGSYDKTLKQFVAGLEMMPQSTAAVGWHWRHTDTAEFKALKQWADKRWPTPVLSS